MSGSLNKAVIVGTLGGDPDVRPLPGDGGGRLATFAVVTTEAWHDKGRDERSERTQWHRIVVLAPDLAEFAATALRKGAKVYVEGRVETRRWTDPRGQERFTTEVVVHRGGGRLDALSGRRPSAGPPPEPPPYEADPHRIARGGGAPPPRADGAGRGAARPPQRPPVPPRPPAPGTQPRGDRAGPGGPTWNAPGRSGPDDPPF